MIKKNKGNELGNKFDPWSSTHCRKGNSAKNSIRHGVVLEPHYISRMH